MLKAKAKAFTVASGLALAVAFAGAAQAQTTGLAVGWNHVKPTNCLYQPGTPAAGTVAATPGTAFIYADVVQVVDPSQPPPPPDAVEFSTTDQTSIELAGPFCKDGSAFWVYSPDGKTTQYFSIYPH